MKANWAKAVCAGILLASTPLLALDATKLSSPLRRVSSGALVGPFENHTKADLRIGSSSELMSTTRTLRPSDERCYSYCRRTIKSRRSCKAAECDHGQSSCHAPPPSRVSSCLQRRRRAKRRQEACGCFGLKCQQACEEEDVEGEKGQACFCYSGGSHNLKTRNPSRRSSCPPKKEYSYYPCLPWLWCKRVKENSAADLYRKIANEEVNQENVAKAASILLLPSIAEHKNSGIGNTMGFIQQNKNKEILECAKNHILESYCEVKATEDYATIVKVYLNLMDSIEIALPVRSFLDRTLTLAELAEEVFSLILEEAIEMGRDDESDILDDATNAAILYAAGKMTSYNVMSCG